MTTLAVDIPDELMPLLDMHRYKVLHGGRGGGKSRAMSNAILTLGAAQKLRILCAREVQRSIKDSVHKLLGDCIDAMGLGEFYQVLDTEIRGRNGTEIIFAGLASHTVQSIKSYEGIDICWVEEAQTVSDTSWRILIPTIRAQNSEIWVSFNPDMDSDPVWQRFIVRRPTGAWVHKVTWDDNPWFPQELEQERKDCARDYPEDYANVWGGECRTAVAGAVYAREVNAMIEERRVRPTPYDPRLPVHTAFDLGWNDAMCVVMVQKPTPSTINVINYYEDNCRTYAEVIATLDKLRYRWGTDWLPHDAVNKDPKSGTSAVALLRSMGRKVKVIPRTDVEFRIRAARMMFPRAYMDDTSRDVETGFLGAARLLDCLKRYRRHIPKGTDEPATPVHDQYSHGCDAWGYLAEIVDQIRNEGDVVIEKLPGFRNFDSGMGTLG